MLSYDRDLTMWATQTLTAKDTMSRILIAECKQEVSTFNPAPSRYEDFRVVKGADLLDFHYNTREEVGGALSVFDAAADVELVPSYGASSNTSGGVLAAESFNRLLHDYSSAIATARDLNTIDAAYICLHGAMQAENENDPEGALLHQARRILGEQIPIVVSVDIHGILTDRMLQLADAVVVYHTYPHIDFYETGVRAATLLLKILRDEIRPVTARVKIPTLARGDEMITATGAVGECIRKAQEIEAGVDGLAAGVMWGNPFTDVPELRSNAVVVMDGDEEAAQTLALDLAQRFWTHHEKMQVPLASLQDAVQQAAAVAAGTVVMMDAADATSSGASGDSNAILREALHQGYEGTILAPLVDQAAVEFAFRAGVGGSFRAHLGGAVDGQRYRPLELDVQVRSLSDGKFRSESFGWPWDAGKTAVLVADQATLVVSTRPVSLFDRSFFYANGQDPRHFDMVVVKSPHAEPHMFADWCAKLINVDAPGSTSANLPSLGHTICERPIIPLDEGVTFDPVADVFRRS
jgi:microcystin degradation protein MlrC